ncbi:MAG TPA: MFS transporter [Candidatus Baltobacterales bacterium]|nr:MFS transporter [Candidatus Baltobacterales bacterium]
MAQESKPRSAPSISGAHRWILAAAVLGSGIVFLDSTVVNVALPRIGRDLPRAFLGVLEGQSYVYNSYLLTLSSLLILGGALTDYYGRRRMFLLGLLGFGVTSVLCGLAPTMETLVLFRILQGAAGAMLVPGSIALITANFSGEQRGRAFGVWAGASGLTSILGPLVGGVLVDMISWRVAFLINIPLVAAALWLTWRHVPESRDDQASSHFDWLGAAVVALAVGGLAFGAIYGQQRAWRDPIGYLALALGVLATIALPILMIRSAHPLIPVGLFRSRNFTVTNVSTLLIYGSLYVTFYYLALFQQGTLGYSAAAAGAGAIPGSLFLILFSSRFGSLAARLGPRWFMATGPVLMALGVLWYSRVPPGSVAWRLRPGDASSYIPSASWAYDFLPGSILFGAGLCILVAPLTTALMTSVPVRNSGVGSAINNAISRVGPQLAGALVFVFLTANFYSYLGARLTGVDVSSTSFRNQVSPLNPPVDPQLTAVVRDASTASFHLAMVIGAGLLVLGALVNAFGIRNAPQVEADASKAPSVSA